MTSTRPAALALSALLALASLTACSDDGDDGDDQGGPTGGASQETTTDEPTDETTDETTDDRAPGEVLDAAVDATLANPRASIESAADLQIAAQRISLRTDGRVDYDATIVDTTLEVDQDGQGQRVDILADGETFWVAAEGAQVPAFPDGATYLSGDAAQLAGAETFTQEALVGIVLVLRSGEEAEEGDSEEVDGVEARTFTYTVAYTDALEAAGDDAEALQSALSLTGDAQAADLEIEVAIGPDDVVRRLALEIDAGTVPVGGSYDLELTDVGDEVEPPEAPADDEVATGPEADALLDQLIT